MKICVILCFFLQINFVFLEFNCRNSMGDCEFCYLSDFSFQLVWNKSKYFILNKKYIIVDFRSIVGIFNLNLYFFQNFDIIYSVNCKFG